MVMVKTPFLWGGSVRPSEHVASRSEDVERDSKAETGIAGLQQLFQVCGLFVLPNLGASELRLQLNLVLQVFQHLLLLFFPLSNLLLKFLAPLFAKQLFVFKSRSSYGLQLGVSENG